MDDKFKHRFLQYYSLKGDSYYNDRKSAIDYLLSNNWHYDQNLISAWLSIFSVEIFESIMSDIFSLLEV